MAHSYRYARGLRDTSQGIAEPRAAPHTDGMTIEMKNLADRYVALWNEADPQARTALLRELWTEDGAHVLADPPEEIRDAAANLAFPAPSLEVRGHAALAARVARAHEMFVAPGTYAFRLRGEPQRLLSGVVALRWSMVTTDGEAAAGGLDVLALDDAGRIRLDTQYIGED